MIIYIESVCVHMVLPRHATSLACMLFSGRDPRMWLTAPESAHPTCGRRRDWRGHCRGVIATSEACHEGCGSHHFFPAGSGTCTHHDPTSTDPPPCSRDLPWWNRGIASSRHGACSRPHPKLRECLGLSQTQRTHHCPVQACSYLAVYF